MVGSVKMNRCGINDKIIINFNSIYNNFVLSSLENGVYHSCLIIFEIGTTLFNKMKHLRCIIFFLFLFKQDLNGCFTVLSALRKRLIAERFTSSGSSGREILYSLAIRAICELSVMMTSIFGYLGVTC